MDTAEFDYDLPEEAIAQAAIEPRDAARLLIAATLEDIPFRRLGELLDAGDLLVVNSTRVRHARIRARRVDTGGSVEVLLTRRIDARTWEAMVRPARRLRRGVVLSFGDRTVELLTDPDAGVVIVAIEPVEGVEEAVERLGDVPLPPYFHGTLSDPERYQTRFARHVGSAAAPTAALHFTDRLVEDLAARGVGITEVELEVGIDTFRPMAPGPLADHRIHTERIRVPADAADAVDTARRRGGRVVAVGTTVVRTLESVASDHGRIRTDEGPTDLFIAPGYRMRVVDAVITNFHAPRTSLLVLVAALLGDRWRTVYDHAIERGLRFLSFGDAMFIEVQR